MEVGKQGSYTRGLELKPQRLSRKLIVFFYPFGFRIGSWPPAEKGWHLNKRLVSSHAATKKALCLKASSPYSEQVGWKRQLDPNIGEIKRRYALIIRIADLLKNLSIKLIKKVNSIKRRETFYLSCVFLQELFALQQKTSLIENRVCFFFFVYWADMYVSFVLQI